MPETVVILIYRPEMDDRTGPFSGIDVLAIEHATGGLYEDIIGPARQENPGSQFYIEEL